MNKSDFLMNSFNNIQELIKFFEQKSNILLVIYGFISTAYISVMKKLKFSNFKEFDSLGDFVKPGLVLVLSIIIFIILIFQLYILIFHILRPRIANHYRNDEVSLFYFGHIANLEKDEFIARVNSAKEQDFDYEIANQVYEISKIAKKKEYNYNKLAYLLFVTVMLLVVLVLFTSL